MKVNFYLRVTDGTFFNNSINILRLSELIKFLKSKFDGIKVLSSTYNCLCDNNVSFIEFLFSSSGVISADERTLLRESVLKLPSADKDDQIIKNEIRSSNYLNPTGVVGNEDAFTLTLGVNFISDENTYYDLKRHYLQNIPKKQLNMHLNECYPNLIFNSNMDEFNWDNYSQSDICEVIAILSLLDKDGLRTYENYSKNAAQTLAYFSSKGFICSGESHPTNCNVVINNTNVQLACSPHFKIEKANSNKRLYFAWGWGNYDHIIICRIGKHFK